MNLSEKIYHALVNAKASVSGAQMADHFGVSRNSIWKHVKKLRERGIPIRSQRSGYELEQKVDLATEMGIRQLLGDSFKDYGICVVDQVTSTNDALREQFQKTGKTRQILVAREQTAGRGRGNKSFASPKDCGLYLSILLPPLYRLEKSLSITCRAAVCAQQALQEVCKVSTSIKWVNDLILHDKKLAGILTESNVSLETGELDYVIIGIGINLEHTEYLPKELGMIATSVYSGDAPAGTRNALVASILKRLVPCYYHYERYEEDFITSYDEHLYRKGEVVLCRLREKDPWIAATIRGIDEHFHLLLEFDGRIRRMSFGEFFLQPKEVL